MATDTAGRAAMHLHPMSHGEASSGDARKNVAREGMRDLDEKDTQHFAAQNPNIVAADTHKNVSFVNDGNGGFRPATNVNEAVEYQRQRREKVNRKIAARSMESMDFVVHLPKSMCVEVPDFYPGVRNEKTGKTGKRRSRWVARDEEEAKQYFRDALEYLQQHVFPGGQASVAWYSMQFDESTPHIQGVSDVFDEDPKKPGTLRISGSRAYMSHRDVVYEDGPKKGKQISGQEKLRNYQTGLREHMISLGYPVEAEVSDRAHESFTKERYGQIMDRQRQLDEDKAELPQLRQQAVSEGYAAGEAEAQELVSDATDLMDQLQQKQQQIDDEREKLDTDKEVLPKLRRQAASEGRKEGYKAGQAEAKTLVADAEQQARDIVQQAQANVERLRKERERLEQENEDKRKEIAGLDATINDRWEELATAGNEVADKQAELRELLDHVSAVKASRDNMTELDSDFLDVVLEDEYMRKQYDMAKDKRAKKLQAATDSAKDYYESTAGKNGQRPGPKGGGNGKPKGGGNGKPKGDGQPDF
ncbi:hypothetical protein HMPREF2559_12160 [Corynebacterium sp. HMSC072G08]|uniref:hypothetical protein n=1 Tax=Corynebacterium sp. HMSC072G08 TaxID=1715039 RepID=UPI0008A3051C|nr:hypothetical protein [Corynebacterium sp. HMSC072G08]OFN42289.1 hypothetical protein HMPREF2559_12160 [Corynebacterium sp. HMSC072G08]